MAYKEERSNGGIRMSTRLTDHPLPLVVTGFELTDGVYTPVFGRDTLKEGVSTDLPPEMQDAMDGMDAVSSSSPSSSGSSMQKKVELEMREKEFIIEGTAESAFPNPYLVAGKPVVLQNLGYNFSGTYATALIKHTIGLTGYTQEMTLSRNATGLDFLSPPKQPAEEGRTIKSEVDPNTDDAVTHTVVKGETLWGIAKKYYGNGAEYPKIVAANPIIKDPNLIYPGQKFIIP